MVKTQLVIATAAWVVGVVGVVAQAQSAPPLPVQGTPGSEPARASIFDYLDRNKDGSINQDEALSSRVVTSYFSTVDADRDGSITRSEFRQAFVTPSASSVPLPHTPAR